MENPLSAEPAGGPLRAAWARRGRGTLGPTAASLAALVALVVVSSAVAPNFATASNLWNVLLQVSPVWLVAVGTTLVIATAGVDLSVGSVMALASAICAMLLDHGMFVAIVAALAGALVVGALNGMLVGWLRVQPIVVTLATLIAARGAAQVVSRDGELVTIRDAGFAVLGNGHLGPLPVPVVVALVAAVSTALVLRATPFGRYVLAVGGNSVASRLAGVPVRRTLVGVYVASAGLSAVAGLVVASRLAASDAAKIGQNMELDAIAATVVGGTALTGGRATVLGTVIGALIMQVIATTFNMLLVPYAWSLVLKAAIILIAVHLQRPQRV